MPPKQSINIQSLATKTVKFELIDEAIAATAEWVDNTPTVRLVSSFEKSVRLALSSQVDLRRINRALRGKHEPEPASTMPKSDLETA